MKFLMLTFSVSQIKALLRKDLLVRWRQPWMSLLQFIWPCMIFMLLYLIRLKFGPENIEDCQFPTRLLPTKNNVIPGFYSYICSIENKCLNTTEYEEYSKWESAPLKPIIDIVNIFITDDRMFNSVVELPEKANFISAVTTLVTSGHLDTIRKNVEKVIDLVPHVEKMLNGNFDIKKLFSDRKTFVKAGNLMCGHPFPSTESIPLVNDILYSEDFSEINDDELNVMPTKYCKKLYLDVTSTNHGKLTWESVKPIIHGKILYAPSTEDTKSIMQFTNSTFEELNRLKMLSVAIADILTKLREDQEFQKGFDSLLKLAQSPFIKSIIGEEFDIDQVQAVIQRIRTDPIIYDVITTLRNLLECFSVDRFVAVNTAEELRRLAYEMAQQRQFYAAVYFNETNGADVSYKFHMDTDNTQPTIENKNRFWFPGPSGNMLRDLKYHRGFIQIKQSLDLAIIKHKKQELRKLGIITEKPTTTTESSFKVQIVNDDDDDNDANDDDNDDEDDDAWFTNIDTNTNQTENLDDDADILTTTNSDTTLLSNFFSGFGIDTTAANEQVLKSATDMGKVLENLLATSTIAPTTLSNVETGTNLFNESNLATEALIGKVINLKRSKRQGIFDFLSSLGGNDQANSYEVDNLQYHTKQFPYPAYIHDDFKTGLYLAQAVQVAFLLGLIVEIATCVRHRIWMRESRNSMIMRSMGLKPCSEMCSWVMTTFSELVIIFLAVTVILYTGGILFYTKWLFVMVYLLIFAACLIAFCYMCSTFFTSATIGAVATAILFFITFCPYIIVLLFDAQLNSVQNFAINLSFTTAFANGWSQIMRMELQQIGLSFMQVFDEGLTGDYGFAIFMLVLDMCIYIIIGFVSQRYKSDEYRFIVVQREDLDSSVGATMTNVSKIYDDNKIAVSNISLTFPRNEVTCLLGRNGAGKSTIIKMLTGQVVQTTGRVILSQAMSNSIDYDNIGVCSQDNILIPTLTAREHLQLYAKIKLKHGYESEVEKTLKNLNFGKHESYKAEQLSGGYKRRLCVAIAFIGSPNVVILDEPCNGVDNKARKDIWELIERLRKGRAVVFATHFLDEAEYLSDTIVIMKNGKILAKHNPDTLKSYCTSKYVISLQCCNSQTTNDILQTAAKIISRFETLSNPTRPTDLLLEIPYDEPANKTVKFLEYLHELERNGRISELNIESENLEQLFKTLDLKQQTASNGHTIDLMKPVELKKDYAAADMVRDTPLTRCEAIRELFWKRLVHFSRNYRILLCVIVLPAIFELLAMWFVAYRLEDDFDKVVSFKRHEMYPKTTQMLSMERSTEFTGEVYRNLKEECTTEFECKEFTDSKQGFYWILNSLNEYNGKRYGGYTFNDTTAMVWYNNKGYHAMMAWLNDLNTKLMQTELNDTSFSITCYNEPWKLGFLELSTSSILRQAGDSCMAFILLIAFSLVVAVAAVYLVNERMNGEKLQQKLCGVDAATYWGVAFVWDFLIIILAILVCTAIILAFSMPIFVDRQQLWGLIVLSLFFGFACIPAVHVFEKLFTDSSVAIVSIFCMNLIIPMFTMAIIVLLGVIGDSEAWDDWRYFLNRAFLIFPQHALGDGLLEICKNYMVALVFKRYDIDSYKNPVNSDLLMPHLVALFVLGVFFSILNVLLESGVFHRCKSVIAERLDCLYEQDTNKPLEEIRIVSIQNSLKRNDKYDGRQALKVDNLTKSYQRGHYAVRNVTFAVHVGECFGLLGKNGAGKSTIFNMLSGQIQPCMGVINYATSEISYCPQTNTLDSLLTVTECIEFYGRLRRIINIPKLVSTTLETYQLSAYSDVLVKNLSGGNRRKLTVATTCCGSTKTVLMDEPTSDMDPVTRAFVYRTIAELLAKECAIVLTSHSISEIDEICHRVAVLKDGQILTCNSPESLKSQYGGYYNVTLFIDRDAIANVERNLRQFVPQCTDLQLYTHSIKFSVKIKATNVENEEQPQPVRECAIDIPPHMIESNMTTASSPSNVSESLSLAELFHALNELSQSYDGKVRFAVNRCRLDAVFERILDTSEKPIASKPTQAINNGLLTKSTALSGTNSTGYIHNGFIETETVT